MFNLVQNRNDPEPCRMRNLGGSEMGTCSCFSFSDCPNPPLYTPVALMASQMIDHYLAELSQR